MSLTISLPPEQEERLHRQVESGLYGSTSEIVCEALRLFETYQSAQNAELLALKADIEQGVADIEAGRVGPLDIDAIKQRGRDRLSLLRAGR